MKITIEDMNCMERVLCYNTKKQIFEIIEPAEEDIDPDNHTITVKLEDISALALIRKN